MVGFEREFLKTNWDRLEGFRSDQSRGVEHPPLQKEIPPGAKVIPLPEVRHDLFAGCSLDSAIASRRSVRKFTLESISIDELSWLLWATQGVRGIFRDGVVSMRTVPSAGARHPFETYLVVNYVDDLDKGLYRYLPLDHSLVLLGECPSGKKVTEACNGQVFCGQCAVGFFWTAIPYRTEWRYGPVSSKIIAIDVGHLCQNLYLAVQVIGAGTCAVGAYNQKKADEIIDIDGLDEFVIYIAPVGRVENKD